MTIDWSREESIMIYRPKIVDKLKKTFSSAERINFCMYYHVKLWILFSVPLRLMSLVAPSPSANLVTLEPQFRPDL